MKNCVHTLHTRVAGILISKMNFKLVLYYVVFTVVLLIVSIDLMGQGYKTLKIKKSSVKSNMLFKEGSQLSYDCFINSHGQEYRVCLLWKTKSNGLEKTLSDWKLVEKNHCDCEFIVDKIRYIVPLCNDDIEKTNRHQTEVKIEYLEDLPSGEYTGIVENDMNIWMHPPRGYFFKILNICPYPFVKLPVRINDSWSDKIKISSYWSDSLWGIWDKKLHMDLHYKVDRREKLCFARDTIECYVINALSYSNLGESQLCIYYNKKFGFVRLKYNVLEKFEIDFFLKENQ